MGMVLCVPVRGRAPVLYPSGLKKLWVSGNILADSKRYIRTTPRALDNRGVVL